ncbi:MFS transporter [Candidatus Micrarchaeota archaeon]|nr:MFS transporter [Candidatus Micrarchaeota archaeon]MBU1929910.1 MFS transporter [Candidatus Micrarchaeota archaeon]
MRKWLKTLLVADSFAALASGMLLPIYAIFVGQIGGDLLDASSSWAVFAIIAGILIYVMGRWEDKHKHYARLMFSGYLLRALAFLGYFFVSNTTELFLVQIILGISAAVLTPSYDALYSSYLDKGKYATEWGAWEGMTLVVEGIAALMGGAIVFYFGFSVLFLIMFLTGLLGALISIRLMSKKAKKATSPNLY